MLEITALYGLLQSVLVFIWCLNLQSGTQPPFNENSRYCTSGNSGCFLHFRRKIVMTARPNRPYIMT
jgi:hypothetical protein